MKEVVFSLNKDSAYSPDGFSGGFFQSCWDTIKGDICKMVMAFFCGSEVPKYVSQTNVVLIPKKEKVSRFLDLRPISLTSFANNILSKVLHERIAPVLPGIISKNQSGFMKERNISENILLAQEIIRDINKRNKFLNVVVKLDMTKPMIEYHEFF